MADLRVLRTLELGVFWKERICPWDYEAVLVELQSWGPLVQLVVGRTRASLAAEPPIAQYELLVEGWTR